MPTLKFGIYVDASYAYDKITNNARTNNFQIIIPISYKFNLYINI